MTTISIDEIQNDVGRYFDRVQAGETLLVTRMGQPVAEIKPIVPTEEYVAKSLRPIGLAEGEFVVPDDFDAPLPEEILREFEGR